MQAKKMKLSDEEQMEQNLEEFDADEKDDLSLEEAMMENLEAHMAESKQLEEEKPLPKFDKELKLEDYDDEPKSKSKSKSKLKPKKGSKEDPLDDMDAELDLKQFLQKNVDMSGTE